MIPLVFTVAEGSGRAPQTTGATMMIDGGEHRFPHERATPSRAGDGVDLGNYPVVQLKMHPHV